MKRQQLIAITRPQGHLPDGMQAIVAEDLAAIFAPLPGNGRFTRRGVLRAAARRQACLEGLLPRNAVLPVLPGHTVPIGDVTRMLRANAPALTHKMEEYGGKVQYQITFAIDEAVAEAQLSSGKAPVHMTRDMTGLRTLLATHFADQLQIPGIDVTMLPLAGGLIANAVVLVEKTCEPALHETVGDIDAFWPEAIRLRMIGPSPAVSFASVGFLKTGKREIAQALAMLDLDLTAAQDETAVTSARKTALRNGLFKPQQVRLAADIAASAGRLREAEAEPFHRVTFWAEGMAAVSPITLREAA